MIPNIAPINKSSFQEIEQEIIFACNIQYPNQIDTQLVFRLQKQGES